MNTDAIHRRDEEQEHQSRNYNNNRNRGRWQATNLTNEYSRNFYDNRRPHRGQQQRRQPQHQQEQTQEFYGQGRGRGRANYPNARDSNRRQ
jgi:hypothetical protein